MQSIITESQKASWQQNLNARDPNRRKRFFAFLKRLFSEILIPLLLLAGFLYWILLTNTGLNSVFWLAKKFSPGQMTVSKVQGNLWNSFVVLDLHYSFKDYNCHVKQLSIQTNLKALLKNSLQISQISIT